MLYHSKEVAESVPKPNKVEVVVAHKAPRTFLVLKVHVLKESFGCIVLPQLKTSNFHPIDFPKRKKTIGVLSHVSNSDEEPSAC